jgi:hypothetical protein
MPIKHSKSDHTSPIMKPVKSTPVSISPTRRPFRGHQLDLFVFDAETHTYGSHHASERLNTYSEEVAHG